jgi:hypothetical protein
MKGKWAGKKGSHAPMIHGNESEVQATIKHGMTPWLDLQPIHQ